MTPSPVAYFRKLLAMSPPQLQSALANKPLKVRERILAKVNEYAAMDPDERELRLRATDLRWYLVPLLQAPPDQRTARLALVPADLRDLVQSRLMEWQILPPTLQQEFLDNEHTAGYFAGLSTTNSNADVPAPSAAFFDLSPMERQKALGELTGIERQQMEKTLQTFDKLPMRQRVQCIRAFGLFSSMSAEERAEFLKNAQRWSKMTPSERQAWRDLVAHVPQWPPLPTAAIRPPMPPDITPHAPPVTPQNIRVVAATNHS